ncbi:Glutamate Aspartate transport system permease protein GltJ (TC 3.A.1.3.4) [Enterobacter hormaechei]|nr:Glutamate Aspartate transport system permease protein GltJ (TC 3.A.1.3.4) [Enterobacter hormaechei]
MSIDWNWGIFLQQAPFGNTTYLGWLWSGFQVTVALSITAWIIAFSCRFAVRYSAYRP